MQPDNQASHLSTRDALSTGPDAPLSRHYIHSYCPLNNGPLLPWQTPLFLCPIAMMGTQFVTMILASKLIVSGLVTGPRKSELRALTLSTCSFHFRPAEAEVSPTLPYPEGSLSDFDAIYCQECVISTMLFTSSREQAFQQNSGLIFIFEWAGAVLS